MKYIVIFLLLITCYFSLITKVFAVTPTPTLTPKASEKPTTFPLDEQINQLKDRIASRVAELKLVERRGIVGTATNVSDTQLTLSDTHGNTRFVDVDELTKFSSPSAKESFGISDISKGSKIEVLGLYNKQSRRILARFITVTSTPVVFRGTVTAVNSNAFTIAMMTDTNQEVTVDVESTTKTSSFTKEGGLVRGGFSKIQEGSHTVVIGFSDKKDIKRLTAARVLLFPQLPKNPKIVLPQPALNPQESPPASTGSGKKLTPITR